MLTIHILPGNYTFQGSPKTTILQSAKQHGFRIPWACAAGNCYVCDTKLIQGSVTQKKTRIAAGIDTPIRSCLSKPETDVTLYMDSVYPPGVYPLVSCSAQIKELKRVGWEQITLSLLLPAGKAIEFEVGQQIRMTHCGKGLMLNISAAQSKRAITATLDRSASDLSEISFAELFNQLTQQLIAAIELPFDAP